MKAKVVLTVVATLFFLGAAGLIFIPLVSIFFAQDDFFLLTISKVRGVNDWLNFFIPRADTVWYRPLAQQFFFATVQSIFGPNPEVFHLLLLLTHGINIILLFYFLSTLLHKKNAAIVGSLFYAFSPSHFVSLAWPAAYAFVLGPTFYILSLIFFIRFLRDGGRYWYSLSLFGFVLSLFVMEVNVVLPLCLLAMVIFMRRGHWRRRATELLPFLIFDAFLVIYRLVIFPPMIIGTAYQYRLGPGIVSLAVWYGWRLFGLVQSVRMMTPAFTIIHIGAFVFLWIVVGGLPLICRDRSRLKTRVIALGLVMTGIGLMPFLLLPDHVSPHYLAFALIGVAIIVAEWSSHIHFTHSWVLFTWYTAVFLTIAILSWSGYTAEKQTHWIVRRANMAQNLIKQHIYRVPAVSEEYMSLGGNFAQFVYDKKVN